MKILDKLKTLFKGKFDNIFNNNTLKIFDFSKNTTQILEIKDKDRLSLDISKATNEQKKFIKEEIIDAIIQQEEDVFLLEKYQKKTEQIKINLPLNDDKELLKFYRDKLKPDMFRALEASLIVRNAWKNKENILELKRDIAWRYPTFGNNICNLVTRDYFKGYFKELFETMIAQEDFNILNYQKEVERIVESLPYMVFINKHKSYEEFSGEVKFKLDRLKKYGTGKLKLHGLGKENVEKALRILEDYKEDKSLVIEKDVNSTKTIITAIFKF